MRPKYIVKLQPHVDLPGGSDSKASALQGRRPRVNSWVGKISWRRKWQPTSSPLYVCVHVVRTFKIQSLGNFQVYNIVLLTLSLHKQLWKVLISVYKLWSLRKQLFFFFSLHSSLLPSLLLSLFLLSFLPPFLSTSLLHFPLVGAWLPSVLGGGEKYSFYFQQWHKCCPYHLLSCPVGENSVFSIQGSLDNVLAGQTHAQLNSHNLEGGQNGFWRTNQQLATLSLHFSFLLILASCLSRS